MILPNHTSHQSKGFPSQIKIIKFESLITGINPEMLHGGGRKGEGGTSEIIEVKLLPIKKNN